MGLSENRVYSIIFPTIAIFHRDNDQQNHCVKRGTNHFQTHPHRKSEGSETNMSEKGNWSNWLRSEELQIIIIDLRTPSIKNTGHKLKIRTITIQNK